MGKKSIIPADLDRCFFCGSPKHIEIHHIYEGRNRDKSTQYGCVVALCHNCHNEPPYGVHFWKERDAWLKKSTQLVFEARYPDLSFQEIFGRNYIDCDDSNE